MVTILVDFLKFIGRLVFVRRVGSSASVLIAILIGKLKVVSDLIFGDFSVTYEEDGGISLCLYLNLSFLETSSDVTRCGNVTLVGCVVAIIFVCTFDEIN